MRAMVGFFCEEKFALLASQHRDVLRISFVRLAEKSSFFLNSKIKEGPQGLESSFIS